MSTVINAILLIFYFFYHVLLFLLTSNNTCFLPQKVVGHSSVPSPHAVTVIHIRQSR